MKHQSAPASATTLSPVFLPGKHNTVKHWRHSHQTNALCEQPIVGETHPTGISRECLTCARLKQEYDAARRAEPAKRCPQK
jgi:hypothetical protein